jgi:ubiquinone biosynthesis accessory factor UbiJ
MPMLTTLENLLNRGLPRSPRARELCAQLSGKSVAISIRDIARCRLISNGRTLELAVDAADADATLAGGPLSLLGLASPAAQVLLQRGDVTVAGDSEVAQQFRELLQLLRPDPEEELALLCGDLAAHQLGRLARGVGAFARRAAGVTLQNIADFLSHERGELVSRSEGEQFLRGVDALREQADRLEARLALLGRQRGAP